MKWLWLGVIITGLILIVSMVDRSSQVIGPIHLGADLSR